MLVRRSVATAAFAAVLAVPSLAHAEDEEHRTRVMLGPQFYPSYPGADTVKLGAFVDLSRARGDEPFEFEAADESFGFTVIRAGALEIGPVVNWEWSRSPSDVGGALPKVGFSLEPGVFAVVNLGENFRLRGEMRKGVTGHDGWIGVGGADVVMRDRDDWLFAIGPRVTWADRSYQNAYFGVAPEDAGPSGLPAYSAGSGVQAVGATAEALTQFTPRWGISGYAKYDRLVGDAADSPVVARFGSRNQFSAGLALTYTFGVGD